MKSHKYASPKVKRRKAIKLLPLLHIKSFFKANKEEKKLYIPLSQFKLETFTFCFDYHLIEETTGFMENCYLKVLYFIFKISHKPFTKNFLLDANFLPRTYTHLFSCFAYTDVLFIHCIVCRI